MHFSTGREVVPLQGGLSNRQNKKLRDFNQALPQELVDREGTESKLRFAHLRTAAAAHVRRATRTVCCRRAIFELGNCIVTCAAQRYTDRVPNNSNENYSSMCLDRVGLFGQC